jgi:hypothetical protein
MSNCKHCDKIVELVNARTKSFMLSVIQDTYDMGAAEHLRAPEMLLMILDGVCDVLGKATDQELARILKDEGTKEADLFIEHMVQSSFRMLEGALPIEVHAHGNVTKEQAKNVTDMLKQDVTH